MSPEQTGQTPKQFITQIFRQWEEDDNIEPFLGSLAEDLIWTAIGTTPLSGTTTSKAEYIDKIIRPVYAKLTGPIRCQVRDIVAEGDKVVVFWHGAAPTISGEQYVQDYCWLIRVRLPYIQEVIGFFDTAAVENLERMAPPSFLSRLYRTLRRS